MEMIKHTYSEIHLDTTESLNIDQRKTNDPTNLSSSLSQK